MIPKIIPKCFIINIFLVSCDFIHNFLCSVGSGASFGVGLVVKISAQFFIGNNLLSNLLRTFSLVLKSNPKLF